MQHSAHSSPNTLILRGVSPTRVDQVLPYIDLPWFKPVHEDVALPCFIVVMNSQASSPPLERQLDWGNFTLPGVISRFRSQRCNSAGLKQGGERFCKPEWTRIGREYKLLHNSAHQILGGNSSQINHLKAESP